MNTRIEWTMNQITLCTHAGDVRSMGRGALLL